MNPNQFIITVPILLNTIPIESAHQPQLTRSTSVFYFSFHNSISSPLSVVPQYRSLNIPISKLDSALFYTDRRSHGELIRILSEHQITTFAAAVAAAVSCRPYLPLRLIASESRVLCMATNGHLAVPSRRRYESRWV